MKKWIVLAFSLLISKPVIAEDTAPPEATPPVAATEPQSVGATGETVSAPQPVGMTERQGEEIFITLTRTALKTNDLPFNTQSTTPKEATTYDAQNAGDMVSRLTSVSVTPTGRLGTARLAGIRGATSNQTLVLIDGRPMGGVGLSASQDMAEIPPEQIDHIEIVRGGVSALYGPNAIGGVINVITKRATHSGLPVSNVGMEFGSYGRQGYRLNFGSRTGPVDYFFSGNQQTESGFRDNSDARTHNIGGNMGLSMGKAGKLLFDISSYHANAGVPGQLFPPIPPADFDNSIEKTASTPDARQITDSGYLRTSYLLPLPMDSLATLRLYGSQRRVQFEIPSFFVDTDRHEQTKGGEAQFNLPVGFVVGGTFNRDRLDSDDLITPANHYIASVENWGLYGQWNGIAGPVALIPSIRFDQHSESGESTSPRVQGIVNPVDWLRLSASAGKSFRAPTIDDLFTPFTDFGGGFSYEGNPNLQPEKAWTYDAGFEVHHSSFSFSAGYFRANINNLIQTTPDLASTSINVGEARRQGTEIEIAHVLNRYIRDSVNYTYLDNQGKPQGFTDWVNLRLSPRHTVNYLASIFPIKGLKWDNTLRYVSTRYEGNNNSGTKLGDYLIWGMRLAYQIRQLEVYVGVDDINNKRYEERGGFPLPGRTAYGGLTLRLWG